MHATTTFKTAVFAALLGSTYAQVLTPAQVGQLRDAPTAAQRLELLKDSDFVFDFLHSTTGVTTGAAGHTVFATSDNFAAVVGNGISMAIGFLGPCSMNTPHTHPRATEINFSVNGTLRTGLLTENGARFVVNSLPAGSATIFPMGAIHFEMNTGCEPATFVAAFDGEDPGVNSISQRYFGLPPDIVGAALGGLGVEEVVGLEAKIPDNVAAGTDECLQRCGLTRPVQPTLQHQPIVSGNAPSGVSVPSTTTTSMSSSARGNLAAGATTASTTGTSVPSGSAAASPMPAKNAAQVGNSDSSTSGDSGNNNTSSILVALLVVNILFAIALLLMAFLFFRDRSRRATAFDSHKYANPSNTDTMSKVQMYESEHDPTYYVPYYQSKASAEIAK